MLVKRAFKALSLLTYAAIFWIQPQLARAQTDATARVQNLQYQTTGDSTRIVLVIDGDVEYRGERISHPDRIFFDLSGAKLGAGFGKREVVVENELLKRIRVAQNQPDVVRIVLDLSEPREYSVSELQNPNRMVIDLYGPGGAPSKPALQTSGTVRQNHEIKEDTVMAAGQAAVSAVEDVVEFKTNPDAKRAQSTGLKEQKHIETETLEANPEKVPNGPAQVQGLQYRAGGDSAQIIIDIDGDTEYKGERISHPDRIFFDISAAKLGPDFENRNLVVENELLKGVRVAQNRQDVVRIVLDVSEVSEYSVSELQGPNRMVINLYGPAGVPPKPAPQQTSSRPEDIIVVAESHAKILENEESVVESDENIPEKEYSVAESVKPGEPEPGTESRQTMDKKGQNPIEAGIAAENAEDVRNGHAWVRNLRYQTTGETTQVIISLDGDVEYICERISHPDRIFLDISFAELVPNFENRNLVVENELLKRIRVAQNRPGVVRVVLDVSEARAYSVAQLREPNRMVIDLHGPNGAAAESVLEAAATSMQDTERKEDAGTTTGKRAANEAESLTGPRADTDAESTQTAGLAEEQVPLVLPENGSFPPEEESKASPFAELNLNSSPIMAENEAVLPPKPVSNSIVPSSSGFSFMSAKPFTVDGVLTSGYYSSYTRGGSNDAQTIHYIPASAKFDINGFFLTPDLVNYSIQPEWNASPQASDAGFQGGNGLRMRIDTLRRQPILMSFRYADVRLEDAYFGSLSQLSSYTLNNRNKELGMTSQLRLPGLPTATMDWGTNSVMSQSLIPEIPEYVSESDHRNIDINYQKWGWDFRGYANRQQQTSNLYTPGEGSADSSILHQKLKQYRGSLRWNSLRDLELSLDAGNQSTSNLLLNRPIRLTSSFGNVNLRLFQTRRWKTSLRAGYTSNISDLLLTSLITDLSAAGSVAPDESILLPMQRTTSSLNLGGYTSVDLSHGLSTYASVDRTEVSPAGNMELRSRNLTATAGMAYSKIFGWGNISGQYGRSYGNGSVTGQRGRIDGQNYAVTVQPGRWEALQLDFSLRGTDQRIVNELPVHNKSFAFEGNVGFRVFGGLRSRIGGGWQKSSLTNADNSFLTEGYTARAALEHRRFQIAGSLNSVLGSPLQAYDQALGGIGIDPTLLTPLQIAPSIFRGFTLSIYAVPMRMLELSTLYTRSLQRRDGVFGNDFETIDAVAKFNFRNLKFEAGYFRSAQVYTNNQIVNPETERGRFYFRVSRTFKF